MKRKLLLIGGGGYCKQVIEILKENADYDEIGIVEKDDSSVSKILDIDVVGRDSDLENLYIKGWTEALVTLGSVGNTNGRRRVYENIKKSGFSLPVIVSKASHIAKSAILHEGSIVHPGSIIDADVEIGICSIINKGSILSHNCAIGDFVHVSPGCILLGNVEIGNDSHIGASSSVREGTTIGNNTMIGMGSIVVKNIPDNKVAYGNPCEIRKDR